MIRHYEHDPRTGRCRNCDELLNVHLGRAGEIGRCREPVVTLEQAKAQRSSLIAHGYDEGRLRIVPADEVPEDVRTDTGGVNRTRGWRVLLIDRDEEETWKVPTA